MTIQQQYDEHGVAHDEYAVEQPTPADVLFVAEMADTDGGYKPAITMVRKSDFLRMSSLVENVLDADDRVIMAMVEPGVLALDPNYLMVLDHITTGAGQHWMHRLRWASLRSAYSFLLYEYPGMFVDAEQGRSGLAVNWRDFFWTFQLDDGPLYAARHQRKTGAHTVRLEFEPESGHFGAMAVDDGYLYVARNGVAEPHLEKRALSDLATVVAEFNSEDFITATSKIRGVCVDDTYVYFQIYDTNDNSGTLFKCYKDSLDFAEAGLADTYDMGSEPLDHAGLCVDEEYLYAVVNVGGATATVLHRLFKEDTDEVDFGEKDTSVEPLTLVGSGATRRSPVACLAPGFTQGTLSNEPIVLENREIESSSAETASIRVFPFLYKVFSSATRLVPTLLTSRFWQKAFGAATAVTSWLKIVAPRSKAFVSATRLVATVNMVAVRFTGNAISGTSVEATCMKGLYGLDYDELEDDYDGVDMTPETLTDDHEGGNIPWPG